MNYPSLFSPLKVGRYQLKHRLVLAPLTRMRAEKPSLAPLPLNAEYYAQRATPGGLLIAEASPVTATGFGSPGIPGIYTEQQVAGWRKVVDAVHAKGSVIFLQLWHVGRVSHSSFQPGGVLPVAPSDAALHPCRSIAQSAWARLSAFHRATLQRRRPRRGQPSERAFGDGAVPPDLERRADHGRWFYRRDRQCGDRSGSCRCNRVRTDLHFQPGPAAPPATWLAADAL